MSPLVITLLIVVGIFVLIGIAFINSSLEKNKMEKARLKADLNDRVRRTSGLSETLPGQLMSPALKLLLSKIELSLGEKLLPLDKGNSTLQGRLEELRGMIAAGESIAVRNPPLAIATEAAAKDVRFQLENLHSQITRAHQGGLLSATDAKQWTDEIRKMLVLVHIEFFTTLGTQALQKGQPRQARLAFERGVQYLQKQPEIALYQAQLLKMQEQLAHASARALEADQPSADEHSELTEGLKSLDDDDAWKKKSF